jgi:xeroderma pigmentosum group C-complementing protein
MAIPVITGIVVAAEHEEMVIQEWERDEAERVRKEDEKRTKTAYLYWRKFLMGLRIVERVREEYGDNADDSVDVLNPWINKNSKGQKVEYNEEVQRRIMDQRNEDMAGGFFPNGHDEESPPQSVFPTRHDDDDDDGSGFIVEGAGLDELQLPAETAYATPISIPSNKRSQLDGASNEEGESTAATTGQKQESSKSRQRLRAKLNSQAGSKTASRSKTSAKPRAPAGKGKRKQASLSDDEEDGDHVIDNTDEDSSLTSLDSPPSTASPPPNGKRRRGTKRNTKPQPLPQERSVPKRKAARMSETALKSHYFDHSADEDGE